MEVLQREEETEAEIHWFTPQMSVMAGDETRSLFFSESVNMDTVARELWSTSAAFPGTLTGSWIQSGAASC